jgi:hypothetical protein
MKLIVACAAAGFLTFATPAGAARAVAKDKEVLGDRELNLGFSMRNDAAPANGGLRFQGQAIKEKPEGCLIVFAGAAFACARRLACDRHLVHC